MCSGSLPIQQDYPGNLILTFKTQIRFLLFRAGFSKWSKQEDLYVQLSSHLPDGIVITGWYFPSPAHLDYLNANGCIYLLYLRYLHSAQHTLRAYSDICLLRCMERKMNKGFWTNSVKQRFLFL